MWFFRLLSALPFALLVVWLVGWGTRTFGKGLGEMVVPFIIVGSVFAFFAYTFFSMYRNAKRVEKEARRKFEQSKVE